MKFDKTDKKILNALVENGRSPYREIAKKAGVSVVTVMNRVKVLEQQKLIKGYSAELDYEKLGYDFLVIISIRIAEGKLFEVERKIASHPNVFAVYDTTGDFDALIIAKFKNRKSLDSFLKKIQTYEFVLRTKTTFVLNTLKEKKIMLG